MDTRIKFTYVYRDTSIQSTYVRVCKAYKDSIYMCAHGAEEFSLHMYTRDTKILCTYSTYCICTGTQGFSQHTYIGDTRNILHMYIGDTRIQPTDIYMKGTTDSVYIGVQRTQGFSQQMCIEDTGIQSYLYTENTRDFVYPGN
jgi:hypothetical protein